MNMYRGIGRWSALVLISCAGLAVAGSRADYAQQWSLELAADGDSVYQVTLTPEVYETAYRRDLGDVEVFNAQGQSLPAMLTKPVVGSVAVPSTSGTLPWFDLPASPAAGNGEDITLLVERNHDGRVQSINTRVIASTDGAAKPGGWLVDASAFRQPIQALVLDWTSDARPFEQYLRIDGSDDLRNWHELERGALLLDLTRNGEHLRQDRIELDSNYHYLRLRPQDGNGSLRLTRVTAESKPSSAPAASDVLWRELHGQWVQEQGQTYIQFHMQGRFPIELADLAFADNNANEWTLYSRDGDEAAWRHAARPWMVYGVRSDGNAERSAAQPLLDMRRDHQWRLSALTPMSGDQLPVLRLGYHPEAILFLTQGEAPYSLATGSAKAQRAASTLPQTVTALRQKNGDDWKPQEARLGEPEVLSAQAALQPPSSPRDWKTWLLWGLLIAAALVVTGFAISLLRKPGEASG
ncbi:MAG: DUF3999 domain-containing protein [Xanthomonadaceae bacterium]|jgi:hypothetical protein|nr:DUF3999 domain-containing protein [Xanthomonadaceae bacterium]